MLKIFGLGSDQLGLITAMEQELRHQEGTIEPGSTPVGDIWPEADVYRGILVGACVGSRYLVCIDVR